MLKGNFGNKYTPSETKSNYLCLNIFLKISFDISVLFSLSLVCLPTSDCSSINLQSCLS